MSKLKLGVTLPQFTDDARRFLHGARRAEDLGLDSVWVFDHLWPLSAKHRPILEAWTALAAVASATERIGIGTMVTRSSLRNPAVLAAMAATVAAIAPGRLTVGVGSGDVLSRAENEAFGLPYLSGHERTSQLESTMQALAASLGHAGAPRPALWVGGWSTEALRLAGEKASGWNGWGGSQARLRAAATAVGEAAGGRELEISWGTQALLESSDAGAVAKLGRRDPRGLVVGGPDIMAARLRDMVAAGAEHLVVAFPDAGDVGPYELLATEVVPLLD